MENLKRIFIGAAWPYANGSLHLGHIAALLGADILARYQRLNGNEVLFVSGSDCHGTPIVVEAEHDGVSPAEIAEKYHQEFVKILINGLNFSYDIYTKTTTEIHKEVVQEIFLKLYQKDYIYPKSEELPYCPRCQRFLPDRYIEGECPVCHFNNARGDQCDECGALLNPRELLNFHCQICGAVPEWKFSEHLFFKLSVFEKLLKNWVEKSSGWRLNARNFTLNLIKKGLPDRAITRDIEWGIPIPLKGYENKRIYVWFEAVCGYLSASKEWAKLKDDENLWEKFWQDEKVIHYYVHGKDNIPFHTIIWPAILLAYAGLHLPDKIISSEYLTLEKKQFSKSRHWAVWLPDFLKRFEADTLRFYLTINGPETADTDFSWLDYQNRVNGELIGNFANFIHRVLSFAKENFPEGVKFSQPPTETGEKFLQLVQESFISVGKSIETGHFREGFQKILKIVEYGNRYLNETVPWLTIKENPIKTEKDLAVALQVIRNLSILISPYLPITAKKICQMINLDIEKIKWEFLEPPPLTIIKNIQPLYKKIEILL